MTQLSPTRILIVDDSALYRLLLKEVIQSLPNCVIVGFAENGMQALDKVQELKPDVVTLDVEMPDLSGIEVLRRLKAEKQSCEAIMVSRLTQQGAKVTTDALLEGAFDFIAKPSGPSPNDNKASLRRQLLERVEAFRAGRSAATVETAAEAPHTNEPVSQALATSQEPINLVVIGASTGGPQVLREIIPRLPDGIGVPVIVVQHMPPEFTKAMASRLDDLSPLTVIEAQERMPLRPNQVVVAAGGQHLVVQPSEEGLEVCPSDSEPLHGCRPAVDATLQSAAQHSRCLSVILTGMGRDGLAGSQLVKQSGGRVLAQDRASSTVYGMPKAVIEAGIADGVVESNVMHLAILRQLARRGTKLSS